MSIMFTTAMRTASQRIRSASERMRVQPVLQLKTDEIDPNPAQPRKRFDEGELMALASSVRQNGILQPLSVRRDEQGRTILIAGERRLRAARLAGLTHVPCILIEANEQQAAVLALMENLQREDLSCFEEAEGIQRLIAEGGLTREEAALRLGKAQSTLANKLRLLQLHPWQRKRIEAAGLCERHARALLRLEPQRREEALNTMIANQMTVGEAEALVNRMLEPPPASPKRSPVFRDLRLFVNTINHAVDTMRRAGVNARSDKQESERFIEYHIVIPKPAEPDVPQSPRAAGRAPSKERPEHPVEEALANLESCMKEKQPVADAPPPEMAERVCEPEPSDWDKPAAPCSASLPESDSHLKGWDVVQPKPGSTVPEDSNTPAPCAKPGKGSFETLLRRVAGGAAHRSKKPRVEGASGGAPAEEDGQTMLDGFFEYTRQG